MNLRNTVFILFLIKAALSYKQYTFDELCPGKESKNNRIEVKLSKGNESAALIHYSTNDTNYMEMVKKQNYTCEFDVKVDAGSGNSSGNGSGNGIFVSIKNLTLRENSSDHSCVDYIKFTYKNGTKSRHICGNIQTSVQNNKIRNFFDETSGEMKVDIFINSSNPLLSSDSIIVDLVFTAYSSCDGNSSQIKCSPNKCISDVFMNDTILNCPPPGCLDEYVCKSDEWPHVLADEPMFFHFIIPFLIVSIIAIVAILCFREQRKTRQRSGETMSLRGTQYRSDE